MYQKILVPLDGSDLAECTLSHVESLGKHGYTKEVTLLNVVKVDISWANLDRRTPPNLEGMRKKLRAASKAYLEKMEKQLSLKEIKITTKTLEANRPADAIIKYAEDKGMDLIVMATHGHTGFKKMMMGTVAFRVLHESDIPVLLIRPESCKK